MAETDSPLKRLVYTFIVDFAAWLLQTNVRTARPLNVELPGVTHAVDLGFHVADSLAAFQVALAQELPSPGVESLQGNSL